jgi:hypothetical protein
MEMTMSTESYPGGPAVALPTSAAGSVRERLAAVLRALAVLVARVAVLLAQTPRAAPPAAPERREYADGALYEDGRLVGRIEGVDRL